MVEQILYDPMFASDKLLAPGREKGKSFSDYMLRLNSTAEVLRLAGMRKIKTDGGALTRFDLMRLKNPEKADLDKDGKLSSYERARGMAIQKNMKKA